MLAKEAAKDGAPALDIRGTGRRFGFISRIPQQLVPPLAASAFRWLFAVQSFLFDELLARFHGTAPQWWPLSDGGHFENLGGYELIRRRLPVIVIIDAEADPDYTFEGLSNLVRKARLDFGAEIKFLTEEELDKRSIWRLEKISAPSSNCAGEFGSRNPSTIQCSGGTPIPRREQRAQSAAPALHHAGQSRGAIGGACGVGSTSLYDDEDKPRSTLLYIKPTLIGDESADVHRYHTDHPSFPHESTLQQFFDEAQWESYRKLGEHIALKLFQEPPVSTQGKMLPYRLLVPAIS